MSQKNKILIIKANGEKEFFSKEKFENSLKKAGVTKKVIGEIFRKIQKKLKPGMTTKEIYRLTFSLLEKEYPTFAGRYSLKKAIFELGPAGHYFEKLVAGVFKAQGFKVKTTQIIQGFCVKHEVDVIAEKGREVFLVECKFHNFGGIKSDVKTALYTFARLKDIEKRWRKIKKRKVLRPVLFTNTKLTKDAISYGECIGMKMIAWSYPSQGNFQQLLESLRLYPITCLTSISKFQKRELLNNGIVLCRKINAKVLKSIDMRKDEIEKVLKERDYILATKKG